MINAIWNAIITMTTVGYGDFFPKTMFGRITGFLICFWGVFIVSIFVVTLSNKISFDENEERTYALLQRLRIKEKLKVDATFVLSASFKNRQARTKDPQNM
jgi:hypothetical protein